MKTTVQEAFKHCQKLAQSHYENFPVASRLIAAEKRNYVWAIYAFARTADDFADELTDKQESLKRLDDWDRKLDQSLTENPQEPIFIAVKKTIQDCDIPPSLLHDLVHAFRRDVLQNRHPDFEDLLDYCSYSANPIGRLVLLIHGYRDENLFQLSDSICTALQLTNFWQDVSVDLKKNRIYIPQDWMKKYNYTEEDLFESVFDERFIELMKALVRKTEELFEKGFPLIEHLNKDLRSEINVTYLGGNLILNKIKRLNYNVLKKRPVLNTFDKLKLAGKLLVKISPAKGNKEYVPARS